MDRKLVAWARMVKARRPPSRGGSRCPVLFVFVDRRMTAPSEVIAALPAGRAAGLFGVIVRDPDRAHRATLAVALAPLCRARGIAMLVSSDPRLASRLRAGRHLPSGVQPVIRARPNALVTASAHDGAELRRCRQRGVQACFLSPVFPTPSHPGGRTLGPIGLARLARGSGIDVFALGGIDGASAARLPRGIAGAGGIGAFL